MKTTKLQAATLTLLAAVLIITLDTGCATAQQGPGGPGTASITYQTFYDDLSPYGTWIDYPGYGQVWHPGVGGDFRPYLTNGYWDYSNEGWLWTSNYAWGWGPFHYGRWLYDNSYGWLWIPGYEWAPAWVTWGSFDDYYSWAPLMPNVYVGVQFGAWRAPAFYWNVCPRGRIYERNIAGFIQQRDFVTRNVNRITVINNFNNTRIHNQYYAKGPDVREVERYTNHTIAPVSMHEVNRAADMKREANMAHVYRPNVQHPQPREFRRVENPANEHPQRDNEERMIEERQMQQNINRLPVHHAPEMGRMPMPAHQAPPARPAGGGRAPGRH